MSEELVEQSCCREMNESESHRKCHIARAQLLIEREGGGLGWELVSTDLQFTVEYANTSVLSLSLSCSLSLLLSLSLSLSLSLALSSFISSCLTFPHSHEIRNPWATCSWQNLSTTTRNGGCSKSCKSSRNERVRCGSGGGYIQRYSSYSPTIRVIN